MVNLNVALRSRVSYRRWWLAVAVAMTVYSAASYGYFVPQILAFQTGDEGWTAAQIESFVGWWTGLNYARMTVGGIGWLCALRALSLSGTPPPLAQKPASLTNLADPPPLPPSSVRFRHVP